MAKLLRQAVLSDLHSPGVGSTWRRHGGAAEAGMSQSPFFGRTAVHVSALSTSEPSVFRVKLVLIILFAFYSAFRIVSARRVR